MTTSETKQLKFSDRYNEIADLFVDSLLKMKHVSPYTKLNNKFHELLLFTHKEANYTAMPNNRFYMKNNRIQFRTLFPEQTKFYCDIYVRPSTKIHTIEFECSNKWYKFLKEILKSPRSENGVYYCDLLCPELFELIVGKLEVLSYKFEEYILMEQEYIALNFIIKDLPKRKKDLEDIVKSLKQQIDKTEMVYNDTHEKDLIEIQNITLQIITIHDQMVRYDELKQIIVSENIIKVRNIKAFIDAVKKTDDYAQIINSKTIVASAPPHIVMADNVVVHAYDELSINVNTMSLNIASPIGEHPIAHI